MEGVFPPAKCGMANQRKPPDQKPLMSDLHTPDVSSTGYSYLRPAIRDAIDDSISKIVHIQNGEAPLTAERFEHCERQIREACMELGQRVLQEVLEDRDARLPDTSKRDLLGLTRQQPPFDGGVRRGRAYRGPVRPRGPKGIKPETKS